MKVANVHRPLSRLHHRRAETDRFIFPRIGRPSGTSRHPVISGRPSDWCAARKPVIRNAKPASRSHQMGYADLLIDHNCKRDVVRVPQRVRFLGFLLKSLAQGTGPTPENLGIVSFKPPQLTIFPIIPESQKSKSHGSLSNPRRALASSHPPRCLVFAGGFGSERILSAFPPLHTVAPGTTFRSTEHLRNQESRKAVTGSVRDALRAGT